jgi:hypothetical protein
LPGTSEAAIDARAEVSDAELGRTPVRETHNGFLNAVIRTDSTSNGKQEASIGCIALST